MPDTDMLDPMFGPLVLIDEDPEVDFAAWEAQVSVASFAPSLLVTLYGSMERGLMQAHRDTFQAFSNSVATYLDRARQAVFDHLHENAETYEMDAPLPTTTDDLREQLSDLALTIIVNGAGRAALAMHFQDVPWDAEHGLTVGFEREQVTSVGGRDEVLDSLLS